MRNSAVRVAVAALLWALPATLPADEWRIMGYAPFTVVDSSPGNGEGGVSLARETVIRFSQPVDPDSITPESLSISSGGEEIPARLEFSKDFHSVSLFYLRLLPDGARVRVALDGFQVRRLGGGILDGDRDGLPGGIHEFEFDTVSLSTVAGTSVLGRVFASEIAPPVAGRTLSVDRPLEGVTIYVEGAENTLFTTTDALGNFRLENVPAGEFFVYIDGRTVTADPDGNLTRFPEGPYYPFVGKKWVAVAGREVGVGDIYLPLVTEGTLQPVSSSTETVVRFPQSVIDENPAFEDVELRVPPGSLFADNGQRGGRVGIAPVPPERIPSPLPPGLNLPLVITVQTDGPTNFAEPVGLCFPNIDNPETPENEQLPPGAKSALWSFDHDIGDWVIRGSMTVSDDGLLVCTDPGVGLTESGWHGTAPGSGGSGGTSEGPDGDGDGVPDGPGKSGAGGAPGGADEFGSGNDDSDDDDDDPDPAGGDDNADPKPEDGDPDPNDPEECENFEECAPPCPDCNVGDIFVLSPSEESLIIDFPGKHPLQGIEYCIKPGQTLKLSPVNNATDETRISDASYFWTVVGPVRLQVSPAALDGSPIATITGNIDAVTNAQRVTVKVKEVLRVENEDGEVEETITNSERIFTWLPPPGRHWKDKFRTDDAGIPALSPEFRPKVEAFQKALKDAGVSEFYVASTLRSSKRAYLMAYCTKVVAAIEPECMDKMPLYDPCTETESEPVRGPLRMSWTIWKGNEIDETATVIACLGMMSGYGLAPSGAAWPSTKHGFGEAIDWKFRWNGNVTVRDAMGNPVVVNTEPRHCGFGTDGNLQMHAIGATYGVKKLILVKKPDPPHWESFGSGSALCSPINKPPSTCHFIRIPESPKQTTEPLDEHFGHGHGKALAGEYDPNGRALDRSPKFYAFRNHATGEIIRRGRTGASAVAIPSINLPPDTRLQLLLTSIDGRMSGAAEFTSAPNGGLRRLPKVILYDDLSPDQDDDGVGVVAESIIGTNPNRADTDGDGVSDGAELRNGSDPLDGVPATIGVLFAADTAGEALDIEVDNGLAVVADGQAGVVLFNAFNGLRPVRVGQVFVGEKVNSVAITGERVLAVTETGEVLVIDASVPSQARVIRRFGLIDFRSGATAVVAVDSLAWIGCRAGELATVNLETGEVLALQQFPGDTFTDLILDGDVLVGLTRSNLRTFTIDAETKLLGSIAVGASFNSYRPRLNGTGGFVHASEMRGFRTFDLRDPAAPKLANSQLVQEFGWKQFVPTGGIHALAAADQASARGLDDVQVHRYAGPEVNAPFEFTIETPGHALALVSYEGLAYVADGTAGLQVINYLAADIGSTPPEVTISASFDLDPSQAEENSIARLTAHATDDVQVRRVLFYVDGELVHRDGSFPFEYRFRAPDFDAGSFTFSVCAEDTGGNSTCTSPTLVSLVPDGTPPRVTSVFPRNNTFVPMQNFVSAYFSEAMNPLEFTYESFRIDEAGPDGDFDTSDDVTVDGGTFVFDDTAFAVRREVDALPTGRYRVTLATTLSDLAGNGLATPFSWEFHSFDPSTDEDADCVPDGLELALGLDASLPDSDGNGTPDGDEDSDGDGLSNCAELTITFTSPVLPDTDGDGIPDGAEDDDRDGLDSEGEVAIGSDPFQADTDGDGFGDNDERIDGTDPSDPASVPLQTHTSAVRRIQNAAGDPAFSTAGTVASSVLGYFDIIPEPGQQSTPKTITSQLRRYLNAEETAIRASAITQTSPVFELEREQSKSNLTRTESANEGEIE
jgi:hypothetical protein